MKRHKWTCIQDSDDNLKDSANPNTPQFEMVPTRVDCSMVLTLPLIFGPKPDQSMAMEGDIEEPNTGGHAPKLSRIQSKTLREHILGAPSDLSLKRTLKKRGKDAARLSLVLICHMHQQIWSPLFWAEDKKRREIFTGENIKKRPHLFATCYERIEKSTISN